LDDGGNEKESPILVLLAVPDPTSDIGGLYKCLFEKSGLSFEMKQMFVVNEYGIEVIPITLALQLQLETVQVQ
jgi:hypothetical protein